MLGDAATPAAPAATGGVAAADAAAFPGESSAPSDTEGASRESE